MKSPSSASPQRAFAWTEDWSGALLYVGAWGSVQEESSKSNQRNKKLRHQSNGRSAFLLRPILRASPHTLERLRLAASTNRSVTGHQRCSSWPAVEQKSLGGGNQRCTVSVASTNIKEAQWWGRCKGEALQLRSSSKCKESEGFDHGCCWGRVRKSWDGPKKV